jgi:hypothetical protein
MVMFKVDVNFILDFLDDWACESSDLVSCTWSNLVHSEIQSSKNYGCKSHNHGFGLCCDSWINFNVGRFFVSFDKSAIFWILLNSLSHDNIQIESMYSQLHVEPMRGYCFEYIYDRSNSDMDKKGSSQLNCGHLLVLSGCLQI